MQPPTPEVIDAPAAPVKTTTPWWQRKRFIIPGGVLVLALIGSAMGSGKDEPTTPPLVGSAASAMAAGASAGAASTKPAPPPPPAFDTPKVSDFVVKVKVTDKQCFGSAGCNVTVKTSLTIVGAITLDPSKTYEMTYELLGGESGPVIDTMEITGDQYSGGGREHFLSTSSSSRKITAKITDIEEM